MKKISLKLGGLVFASIFAGYSITNAAPTLTLNDGVGDSISLAVGGSPVLTGSAATTFFQTGPGFANWSGSLGVWSFNLGTGNTEPLQGTAQLPLLTLNFQSNGNTAPGDLKFTWSDSGLGSTPINFVSQIGGTLAAGVTLTYSTFYSLANTMPAATPLNAPLTFNTPGGFNGSTTFNTPGIFSAPYSLTQVLEIINPNSAGTFSGNAQLIAVPEPASGALLLLGAGLGAAALRSIRRANKKASGRD
jgi:hypothetical protein